MTPTLERSTAAGQDRRFARAFAVLDKAIAARAFPGAAVAVTFNGSLVALKGVGRFTYDPDSPAVTADTIYDLASVTKVVATTTMAMLLYERGTMKLDMPVVEVLPEFSGSADPQRHRVTLRMLLAHTSGLPAYARLFEHACGAQAVLNAACALPLEAAPGARAEYSDIGFLLLGVALERLAGGPLDQFCAREIFAPLAMTQTAFHRLTIDLHPGKNCHPERAAVGFGGESRDLAADCCPTPARGPQMWDAVPPTEHDPAWRRRIIQGEVQDENTAAMGGVSGVAGLFAPALDVARFAECMLAGGAPVLQAETVALFTRRENSPPRTSRALGWDTPSQPSQSGRYFSPPAFGHLGYAGTSLWIDPERRLSVTLLTNRTWPDRKNNAIKQVRPRFHDAIVEAL
ncbi:MAG: serine hydrolase domain-containing protein [Terriglobales bacterium]